MATRSDGVKSLLSVFSSNSPWTIESTETILDRYHLSFQDVSGCDQAAESPDQFHQSGVTPIG